MPGINCRIRLRAMAQASVAGFLPSTSGFHFANDFPDGPFLEIRLAGLSVPIGNAGNGLCGGMVFAVRDLFEANLPPPSVTEAPARGSPLFAYLVRRSVASFNLPGGPLKYLMWMALPEGDTLIGLAGLARRTVQQWGLVRLDLEAGKPSPVGLIRAGSANPMKLGQNHQVLVYAYHFEETSGALRLSVYDPNHPDDDTTSLSLNVRAQGAAFTINYLPEEAPVRGFFRTMYRPGDRAVLASIAARN